SYIVPSQLKILIPVGMPTAIVVIAKKLLAYEFIPMVNMWCAHTLMLTKAIQTVAATITGYPKIGFRENTGTISDIKAKKKTKKNQDLHLRMSKYPKEVHPERGGPTRLRIEEVPSQIPVHEQHDLR